MQLELNFLTWHRYDEPGYIFVYCIETHSMGHSRDSEQAATEDCLKFTGWELEERYNCENLTKRGWTVSKESIVPPVIDVEKAINNERTSLIKLGYPENFNNFKHFKKLVEIPPARKP
jgi:hypothetical protein